MPSTRHAAAAALAALAAGCATELDTERPASPIGRVVADCVVPLPDRGAPVGLEYDDASLWVFGDGTGVVASDVARACAGDVVTLPAPVVALTPEKEAANQARTDRRALAVRPRGGFVADGVG